MSGKFFVDVDIGHTCLLLADIQSQIAGRFHQPVIDRYVAQVKPILEKFRAEIQNRRSNPSQYHSSKGLYEEIPLIVHHVVPFGMNAHSFVSPVNKILPLIKHLNSIGVIREEGKDPHHPEYAIVEELQPTNGVWGTSDEIIVPKLSIGCFYSSELLCYLRARDIRHVILCGLTTAGAILGSVMVGADLDYHIIVPREGVMDHDDEANNFLLDKIFPKFADVVAMEDVEALLKR